MDSTAAAVRNRSNDQTRTCEDVEGVDRDTLRKVRDAADTRRKIEID